MKKFYYAILFCFIAFMGYSQAVRWGTASNSAKNKNEFGWGIAADSSGNTYVTGYFDDSLRLGTTAQLRTKGMKDVFVAKLDPDGNFLWSTSFGSTGDDEGRGIAVDNNGNIYVTGYFNNVLHLTSTDSLTSAGNTDIFIVKLNNSGTLLTKIREGTATSDYGRAIACTATSGDYAVVGDLSASTKFFVAKYNSTGTQVWNKQSTGGTTVYGNGVGIDNNGRVYLTGSITGSLTSPSISNYGLSDIYVVVYNSAGTTVDYSAHFAGTSNDYGNGLSVNGAGTRLYLCGAFTYSVNFGNNVGGSPVTLVGSPGTMYSFVAQFQSTGSTFSPMWAHKSFNNWYTDVVVDRWGEVFVTDDQTYAVYAYPPYGGNYMWIAAPTLSNAVSKIYGHAVDKYGNVYGTGYLTTGVPGTAVYGDSTLSPSAGYSSSQTSVFVEKISRPVITSPTYGGNACISSAKGDSILLTITPSMTYNPGNVFTLQMDATGTQTFTSSVTSVGTLTATTGGVIHGYIPAGTANNTYLDFRVISSNPVTTGGD